MATAASERDLVVSLLVEVGLELGRRPPELQDIVKRLVDDEWLDTVDALQSLKLEEWLGLGLPQRFYVKLQEKIQSLDRSVEAPPLTAVSLEPPNPSFEWTNIALSKCIGETVRGYRTSEALAALEVLLKLVTAVLADPKDARKRKISKRNKTFNAKVGSKPSALKLLYGIGFIDETVAGDECLTLPTAYLSRLTDASKLLEKAVLQMGGTPPVLQSMSSQSFNPYQSNLVSSRPDAANLPRSQDKSLSPSRLKAETERELRLRATGGGVTEVPLDKMIFSSLKAAGRPLFIAAVEDERELANPPPLSAEELISLRETLTGTRTFKSAAKQKLDALKKRPVYHRASLRIVGHDNTVLQMSFHPTTTGKSVIATLWNQGLSRAARQYVRDPSNISLIEPPSRTLQLDKTLYEQNLVPNATLRLRLLNGIALPKTGVRCFE